MSIGSAATGREKPVKRLREIKGIGSEVADSLSNGDEGLHRAGGEVRI